MMLIAARARVQVQAITQNIFHNQSIVQRQQKNNVFTCALHFSLSNLDASASTTDKARN